MESLDIKWIRSQFPALTQTINKKPAIFFDGPGGTQQMRMFMVLLLLVCEQML